MPRLRFSMRAMLIVVALLCGILGAYAWFNMMMASFFEDVFAGKHGPVASRDEWPEPLKDLVKRADEVGVDAAGADVYCIAHGLAVEYVWRMPNADGLMALIQKEFDLYQDDARAKSTSLDFAGAPPWWSPPKPATVQPLFGRKSNIGDNGYKFIVVNDEQNGFIYVYFNDNW